MLKETIFFCVCLSKVPDLHTSDHTEFVFHSDLITTNRSKKYLQEQSDLQVSEVCLWVGGFGMKKRV